MVPYQELHEIGFKLINYSGTFQRAAIKAMLDISELLVREGSAMSAYPARMCNIAERSELLGLAEFYQLEERLYGPLVETDGSWRKELEEKAASRKAPGQSLSIWVARQRVLDTFGMGLPGPWEPLGRHRDCPPAPLHPPGRPPG